MHRTIALAQPAAFTKIFSINAGFLPKILFYLITLFLFSLFSLLAVAVWQINSYSRDVFLLQDTGRKLTAVAKENKVLEINFNRANSLANFANYVEDQPFEKAAKVDYIRITDKKVVSRAQ